MCKGVYSGERDLLHAKGRIRLYSLTIFTCLLSYLASYLLTVAPRSPCGGGRVLIYLVTSLINYLVTQLLPDLLTHLPDLPRPPPTPPYHWGA